MWAKQIKFGKSYRSYSSNEFLAFSISKIGQDHDLLKTLSIFALEPSRWVNRYEWRNMSDMEMCASGTYWRSKGDAMSILYTKLPSSSKGWQSGLHWLEEVREWSDEYEEAHMVPADTNKQLAVSQLDTLLPKWPAKYRDPCQKNHWIEAGPDSRNGRYVLFNYLAHPWYVKPTVMPRWGLGAWITWLVGYKVPGDDGNKYYPQGYTFTDIGPQALSGKGIKEMDETRARLVRGNRGGCPFSPPQATD